MNVKLELYRVFQCVARQGSISGAAQVLYTSQSAVSQSIRQLEEQLQVRLFTRSARGVQLTRDGQTLLEYVTTALGLISSGEEKLRLNRELLSGELVIGASDTVTSTFLLPYLESFHQDYPAIRIHVINGTSRMVLESLHSGQVDIAFASEMQDSSQYNIRKCMDTHMTFAASPDYPCDFTHPYTMQEIADFPLILLERKASSRVWLEQQFLAGGVTLEPEIELGAHYLLISLARIGLGVACLTEEFACASLQSGEIKALQTAFQLPTRAIVLCTLPGVSPSPAAARFIQRFAKES